MRIIPYSQLILTFLVLSIVTGIVLLPDIPVSTGIIDDDPVTTTTDPLTSVEDYENSSEDAFIEREPAVQVAEDVSLDGIYSTYPFSTLIIYIFAYFSLIGVIAWGFRSYINLPSVQKLVNTSLQLAGFTSRVGVGGRQWKIDDQFILELSATSPHFTIYLPENNKDPRIYGFKYDPSISVSCSPNQIQLTLQSVRSYLN